MQDIDDSIIPGSVYLVDVQEKSTVVHAEKDSAIVLSPTPSNDVNDPLNWSRRRKMIQMICVMIYTSAIGIGTTVLYSILQPIADDTGIPLSTLNAGTGYSVSFPGMGCPHQPAPSVDVRQAGQCVFEPRTSKRKDNGSRARLFRDISVLPWKVYVKLASLTFFSPMNGGRTLAYIPFSCLGRTILHPSSLAMALGHVLGGYYQLWVAHRSFLSMEETNFVRTNSEASEAVDLSNSDEKDNKSSSASPSSPGELVGTPKSFVQCLALFNTGYASNKMLFTMAYRPVVLLRFPVIFWAGFQYGTCLVWYNVLNATCSLILSNPPYNFRASFVGLSYIGPLIGMLLGTFYSGWLGDRFAVQYARRTRGIREPEHRLWLMVVSLLLCPASLILWGVGASKGINWSGLVFGMGMISCSTGIGSSLSIGYALDSYKYLSGEVMMAVILVRNTLSFAIGYGITPWLYMGYQNTFISAAFVGLAITMTFLIVIKWGRSWRVASRKKYWAYVASSGFKH